MTNIFKIVDGDIFMGETPVIGHGCKTLAEKEAYCAALNVDVDPEFTAQREESRTTLANLSPDAKKRILDVLGDDWRHD